MILTTAQRYVFRGTTIGFEGNGNSVGLRYTCTSTHPLKALWFALECYQKFPEQSVVYVADRHKLGELSTNSNHFQDYEEEIAFQILPKYFYPLCEGYLHVTDLQKIMKDQGLESYKLVRVDNLTRICKETPSLSVNEMETILECVLPNLKK